jgi:lipid II:glycine glycyltransferase (peptidoglycan interpeptide bridge formation enzyme)
MVSAAKLTSEFKSKENHSKKEKAICTIEHKFTRIDESKWEDFVREHPQGNFFQTPRFYKFISGLAGFQPLVIAALTGEGSILGILVGMIQVEAGFLKSKLSSRLIVRGGPLLISSDNETAGHLLEFLVKKYSHQCIYFEFRNLFPLRDMEHHFLKNGFVFNDYLDVVIDMEKFRQSIQKLSSGKKRQVKKSLENNARIVENATIAQVRRFYLILKKLYSRKVKKPLPPWNFFEQFFYRPELGRYFLVESSGDIVGGIMCPIYDNRIIYEWYIGGEDGVHSGIYPSVLATWAPIDHALRNGLLQFDFLGAGKPGEDYGVREFKSSFGGELVNYGRFTRINNRLLYFVGKTGMALLKRFK